MPDRHSFRDRAVPTTYAVNLDAPLHEWITVELTCLAGQGPHKPRRDTWAVRKRGLVLNHDEEWEPESLPSSRDDVFLARTRWSLAAALEAACAIAQREEVWRHDG